MFLVIITNSPSILFQVSQTAKCCSFFCSHVESTCKRVFPWIIRQVSQANWSLTFIFASRASMEAASSLTCLAISCLPSFSPFTTSLNRSMRFFRLRTFTIPSMLWKISKNANFICKYVLIKWVVECLVWIMRQTCNKSNSVQLRHFLRHYKRRRKFKS